MTFRSSARRCAKRVAGDPYAGAVARLPATVVDDADSIAKLTLALLASSYATDAVLDIGGGSLLA